MNTTTRRFPALLLAAAAATAALLLLLQMAGGAGATESPQRPPDSFQPDPGSTADASAVFADLRRAPAAADRDQSALSVIAQEEHWFRVAGSRMIGRSSLGPVWLSPTSDGRVCLSVDSDSVTSTTCDTVARARAIGVVLETRGRFVGAVPDGTTQVSLAQGDGGVQQAKLVGGLYELGARSGELTVSGQGGRYALTVSASRGM